MDIRGRDTQLYLKEMERVLREKLSRNPAGGDVYAVNEWTLLERFLILGSTDGGYYVGAQELTVEHLQNLRRCIEMDGMRVLEMTANVSINRRAAKNDQALLVLAAVRLAPRCQLVPCCSAQDNHRLPVLLAVEVPCAEYH